MLHFVAGLYNSLFSTPEHHVLIVGRECAGKSTLLEQFKFLYNPSTQQREEMHLQEERLRSPTVQISQSEAIITAATPATPAAAAGASGSAEKSSPGSSLNSSVSTLAFTQRPALPPGTPLPATAAQMAQKRIRPTVGLNYAVVQHKFSPPVAVVSRAKRSELHAKPVASLPPPPKDVMTEQHARQQALLANAPSDASTRLILRDLGGQTALRDLWEKYYPQSQALIYVVDSTLPFRSPSTTAKHTAAVASACPRQDHFTKAQLEVFYEADRQLLAKLLQHPLLNDVPVLLLSNKVDEKPHLPLAKVQEALQLADLAADRAFYVHRNTADAPSANDGHNHHAHRINTLDGNRDAAMAASAISSTPAMSVSRHCTHADATQRRVGESGFGEVAMRITEVSALDGAGVAGAMDWLVAQLLYRARQVGNDA